MHCTSKIAFVVFTGLHIIFFERKITTAKLHTLRMSHLSFIITVPCASLNIHCMKYISNKYYRHLFIIKPTRCTNFQNLLRNETLHVSGSSYAHHQEFTHCTLGTGLCHTGL